MQVSGYCGLLLGSPILLYEIIAFVLPGLTKAERRFLAPIVLGSSVLFYAGIVFSYYVLTPAALNFFVNYAEGAVESLWSIDQYFEFVLVLMFSTGLSFQVYLCLHICARDFCIYKLAFAPTKIFKKCVFCTVYLLCIYYIEYDMINITNIFLWWSWYCREYKKNRISSTKWELCLNVNRELTFH